MALRCNWINQNGVQCGQPLGHSCGHGNGLLTQSLSTDVWHEFIGAQNLHEPLKVEFEKFGVVWTDKSTIRRCLWQGAHGCCIYELGHTIAHKEESPTNAA